MGKIVVSEFVTLDNVMEGPGSDAGFDRNEWSFKFDRGADGDKFKVDELFAADGLLLGRNTYETFAAAWPDRTDEAGFADKMNGMRKYVVSSTLTDPSWNNTVVLGGDLKAEVTKLRNEPGGNILVYGSATLVHGLVEHNLVDEYRLMVFPVILGAGKRLFADATTSTSLRLDEVRPVGPDGVIVTTYHPA